ncbi:MAG: DegT/DnrJ/EryC1/StrS family aminotransferase [Candidatus Sericytochromatia bacterium]
MIYLNKPYFDQDELDEIKKTFDSGWVAGQGPKSIELAEYTKKITETNFAIPLNNCTAALHLALIAIGIKPEDEVIVSDYTYPATGHSVLYCGAKPRFADVKLDSYNMDVESLKKLINKNTKAIIVVHALGQMADMTSIMAVAKEHNLKVIEDAACAMGAKHNDKVAGSYGDITCFSFHARKNATSGEGGILVTNNEEYADTVSSLSCFGTGSAYKRQQTFQIPSFTQLGYNYKMADINCAIVLAQLKKYPKFLERKRELIKIYNNAFKNSPYITSPKELENNYHVYQTYAVTLNEKIDRYKMILSLKEDEIQTQIGTYSSHIQPIYNSNDKCPNALHLYNNSLALPLYYEITEEQINTVIERVDYHIRKQLEG